MDSVYPETRYAVMKKNVNRRVWEADQQPGWPIYPPQEKNPCFPEGGYVGEGYVHVREYGSTVNKISDGEVPR